MKIRTDFVTNSSSSSFVICKSDLPNDKRKEIIDYIQNNFKNVTTEQLLEDIDSYEPSLYNLVDYNENDDEMHIWVKRDESMDDEFIDDVLHNYDRIGSYGSEVQDKKAISPKFNYHY